MDKHERSEKEITDLCEMAYVYTGGVCLIDDGIKDAMRKGGYIELKRLYDADYRNAKEIFAKCKEKCMFDGYPYGIDYTELVEVFKEFGVEVEE